MKSTDSRTYTLHYDACKSEITARSQSAFDSLLRTKGFYQFFVTMVLGLLTYALFFHPLLTLLFFALCFIAHHICFMIYHSSLHAQFIEIKHQKLLTGPFIAFVHHYVNPKLLCCIEHRTTYQSLTILLTFTPIFALCFYIGGPAMSSFVSTFLLWHLTSSPIHEWYHVPPKHRKNYFNRIEFFIYQFLENKNIISTREHINHHRHQINNKQAVIEFNDINVGRYISFAFDKLWGFCCKYLYQKNKKNMTIFYSALYLLTLSLISGLAILLTHTLT